MWQSSVLGGSIWKACGERTGGDEHGPQERGRQA